MAASIRDMPSPKLATVAKYAQTAESWAALEAFDVVVGTVPSVSPRIGFVADLPSVLLIALARSEQKKAGDR
jgi:hypothetical protein